jgi:hypothetical protein
MIAQTATKHTPGPWEFSYVPGEYGHVITIVEGEIAETFRETVGEEQAVANARLIAAAPELLEALSAILQDIKRRKYNLAENIIDFGMQTIAKAAGGAP